MLRATGTTGNSHCAICLCVRGIQDYVTLRTHETRVGQGTSFWDRIQNCSQKIKRLAKQGVG